MVFGMPSKLYPSLLLYSLSIFSGADAAAIYRRQNSTTSIAGVPQNVPPQVILNVDLGLATDVEFNPNIYRDGGGGGLINGQQVIVFSDSWTNGSENSFTHNTIAYMGVRDASDPTDLFDFGSYPHDDGYRTFMCDFVGPLQPNETDQTVFIWPNSNMIQIPGSTDGLAVYQIVDSNGNYIYNTMVEVTIEAPETYTTQNQPVATRTVPRLFYNGENPYGSFSVYAPGGNTNEPEDYHMYLFSTSSSGIRVARVPVVQRTQRRHYTYWNGTAWSSRMPSFDSTAADLISYSWSLNFNGFHAGPDGPGSGEVFWSPYFNTFVSIFMGYAIDDGFFIAYSTTGKIEGPWVVNNNAFLNTYQNPLCGAGALNYAGHAYPSWDPTGKTMLLSYSSCNTVTTMYQVTFA